MNDPNSQKDDYSDQEAARRRDEALRRALSTPPQPKPSRNPKADKPAAAPASARRCGRPAEVF